MRRIYKILISMFTILILISTIGTAVKPAPTPDPAEQVQDTRLTTLETNSTLQQINNSEQQELIDGIISDINIIKDQILQLENFIQILGSRITSLEDNETLQSRTYVLGKDNISGNDVITDGLWHEITNWTFYLPVNSSVYVESSGALHPQYTLSINMGIDLEPCSSTDGDNCLGPNIREYANYPQSVIYNGFQISKVYFLTKGYHTIYLQGKSWLPPDAPPTPPAKVRPINFNVIASENKCKD